MTRKFISKHKVLTAVTASVLAVVLLLGGTFAWQSINQTALNEVYSVVNPGGRLHDDYVDLTYGKDGIADYETMTFNKDVYVENFTSLANNGVQVYARIRLDEYMELGDGAGLLNADGSATEANKATSVVPGATLADKNSWTTHIMNNDNDPFHEYWNWDYDGQTTYMPTFNKDNTSLDADINGTFANGFTDYTDYAGVSDKHDNVGEVTADATYTGKNGETYTVNETHTAKPTLTSTVISMAAYQEILADDIPENDTGNYWVWDTDGWAYWASPILPDTATGLLLDGISRTEVIIDEDWYYGINVVAQFITKDDIGYANGTGFYADGETVSSEALVLLSKIGVEVPVSDADTLANVLNAGGKAVLTQDVTLTEALAVTADSYLDLNGKTLTTAAVEEDGYGITVKGSLTINGDGNVTINGLYGIGVSGSLTVNGGVFTCTDDSTRYMIVNNGTTVVNNGNFTGNYSCLMNMSGTTTIRDGSFTVDESFSYDGTNVDTYAVMCLTGDDSKLSISGGTFSTRPEDQHIAEGYTVTENEGVYTVVKASGTAAN